MKEKPDFEALERSIRLLEEQAELGRQAASQLRESETRYRRIAEELTDYQYSVLVDHGRTVKSWHSPACVAVTGYTAEEFAADPCLWIRVVAPEDRERVTQRVEQILQGREIPPVEHRIIRKDGELRWVRDHVILSRNESGTLLAYEGVVKDISECRQVEEQTQRLEEALQRSERMEALGHLAAGVAHDLNNILGVVSGYSELLLGQVPEGHRARGFAEKILQATEKGAAIIQDLLTISRRGVRKSDVFNINDVVADFLQSTVFESLKRDHPQVTFRTECDRRLLNVKGSAVHLEKALMHLLDNAAEATAGTGEVVVRTENVHLETPLMGYEKIGAGDYAVLSVTDTGSGIPAEHLRRIFEPFYMKKRMGGNGTGLGLAIVWGTAMDLRGHVDLQTEIGKGSTFFLYCPVTRSELGEQPQQPGARERYMGAGEMVLVADDVAEQRDIASRMLEQLGYRVHAVASGEEVVEYLRAGRADLLVLDMMMGPGMDGLDTYEQALKINPKQKAIIVSGYSETERVLEAERLGVGAYVRKPYMLERLGVAIRNELQR